MRSAWRDGAGTREVSLDPLGENRFRVVVDGATLELRAERLAGGRLRITHDGGSTLAEVTIAGSRRFVRLGSLDFVVEREAGSGRARAGGQGGGLEAPMPGVVTRVMVSPGDAVESGQPLVALEAMKMEHLVRAPRPGRVARVRATVGEMANPGEPLVELEEPEEPEEPEALAGG